MLKLFQNNFKCHNKCLSYFFFFFLEQIKEEFCKIRKKNQLTLSISQVYFFKLRIRFRRTWRKYMSLCFLNNRDYGFYIQGINLSPFTGCYYPPRTIRNRKCCCLSQFANVCLSQTRQNILFTRFHLHISGGFSLSLFFFSKQTRVSEVEKSCLF